MPDLPNRNYTDLTDREIGAIIGEAGPRARQWFRDVGNAVFRDAREDTGAVNDAADAARAAANTALVTAETAQARADAAYVLADEAVASNLGPVFGAVSGTISRAAYTTYTAPTANAVYDPGQMQALLDAVQALSRSHGAAVTDLRANGALSAS